LASFSANPDRPRCPKCRRNTFPCWSGGERQNSATRLHARRPGSQRRQWQSAKGAQRRSIPLPPSSQTRKEHRHVCALWPPWGVTDGIEPGSASAQLMVKASLDGSSDPPPIPAELSANYARTQWNLAPLWRGFSLCAPSTTTAWRWKSSIQPDGGGGLAKRKGVIARWGLKKARSKVRGTMDKSRITPAGRASKGSRSPRPSKVGGGKSGGRAVKAVGLTSGGLRCVLRD
jgi:hypothetical protein